MRRRKIGLRSSGFEPGFRTFVIIAFFIFFYIVFIFLSVLVYYIFVFSIINDEFGCEVVQAKVPIRDGTT